MSGVVLDVLDVTYFSRASAKAITPVMSVSQSEATLGRGWSYFALPLVSILFETSKMDIAPLSKWMSKFMDVQEVPAKT